MKRNFHTLARAATRRNSSKGLVVLVAMALGLTAAASSAQAASNVGLGTADSFAVLGGQTVTNTGPSVINGDLGVSPGSAVTGFPPGLVNGTIHTADAVATQAQADLTIAYNDAAGRASTATISANLAGSTLTGGVYTSATSLGLSGDLTLDAQGDPDAVFIFQAGSTLTAGPGSRVLLIGGAQSCNVFWQIGSSATIDTTSDFVGNILALTSISMNTGATLNGSALARNGAVTLDTNVITKTPCASTGSTGTTSPSATSSSTTTRKSKSVTIVLNGSDSSGAALTYTTTGSTQHGTLGPINQSAGTVKYTPKTGFVGLDSFGWQVSSSNGTSRTATASIKIRKKANHKKHQSPSSGSPFTG